MDVQPKKDDDMTKDILTEFIEVLVHQVLHLRDLYPASIFKKHRKFNMPVQMSVQPWVNEYIEKTLVGVRELLGRETVEMVDMVVGDEKGKRVEVYRLELGNLHSGFTSKHPEDFLEMLELGLASMIVRLGQAVSTLRPLPADSTWWIEVTTRMGEVVRMFNGGVGDWCLAGQEERKKTEARSIVPVMALEDSLRLQLFIETLL